MGLRITKHTLSQEHMQTWAEGVKYTFETRETWRRGSGRQTHQINCAHISRILGDDFTLTNFDQPTIHTLSLQLEQEGKADATINRIIGTVTTVLNHLNFDGLIPSPGRFRKRRATEGRTVFFSKKQVDRIVLGSNKDLGDIVLFAAYTGLRQGEILKLKPEDVDLTRNLIHVGGTPSTRTKARNYRVIPIHERIHDLIANRMHNCYLFDYNRGSLCRHLRKVLTVQGYSELYSFHVLRHSFATWANESGVPIRTIQKLLGHKCIDTTLHYTKVTDEALNTAILSL